MTSPYEQARSQGYSNDEIMEYLQGDPRYSSKISKARQEGYSSEEIGDFLSTYSPQKQEIKEKPKRSKTEKALRTAGQYGLGILEGSPAGIAYDVGVAPLASKEAQTVNYRQNVFEDIERLQEQKAMGIWDKQDQELYDHLIDQIKNPEKAEPYVKTGDVSIRGLAEKATGQNLRPENLIEKAANWSGFIKNPANIKNLFKIGINPKTLTKAIAPSGSELLRGLGAGTALQMAESGEFGPIGTLAFAVAGDLAGAGTAGLTKAITSPKKTLANVASKFTAKDKVDLQKDIIKDFRDVGIQPDIGSITDNNIIKWTQAKLAQSGLSGKAFDDLRKATTDEIKEQYKKIADGLGEIRFQTLNEAGEVGKEYMTQLRNLEKQRIDTLYSKARERLSKGVVKEAKVDPTKLAFTIRGIEKSLKPGAVKSTEQKAVLDILGKLKADIFEKPNVLKQASVQDLINNKIALNDIINYEVQGGQKQLLKQLVGEIDKTIISYGKKDKEFLRNYVKANQDFAEYAKTFRNENINKILTSRDPQILMNKMNTVQGIRDIDKALIYSPEGKQVFNDLKRLKLDQMIGNKMTDNVSEQLKMGTFSNLLKNPKDMQIAKELLGKEAFERLSRLKKATGHLARTSQKFFNASQSGSTLVDAAAVAKVLGDMANILSGNPWPLLKTLTGISGFRYLSNLLADPSFLKLVEDAVLASNKNDMNALMQIGKKIEEAAKPALAQSLKQN